MSFLQRRLSEQAKREAEEEAARNAAMAGFGDEEQNAFVTAENDADGEAPPPPKPSVPKPLASAVPKIEDSNPDAVQKHRTTPKIAQLRKQFRPKLLATIDEVRRLAAW